MQSEVSRLVAIGLFVIGGLVALWMREGTAGAMLLTAAATAFPSARVVAAPVAKGDSDDR